MILTDIGSNKNWAQKLKAAGISHAIFETWLKNPAFKRRWDQIAEEQTANSSLALVALNQRVGEGDMRAIQMNLAISGRYSEQQQASLDIMVFINKTHEIVTRHLIDKPEVMRAVSKELRELAEQVDMNRRVITVAPSNSLGF
jgi:hypothetical protein